MDGYDTDSSPLRGSALPERFFRGAGAQSDVSVWGKAFSVIPRRSTASNKRPERVYMIHSPRAGDEVSASITDRTGIYAGTRAIAIEKPGL
jgi:hypothetical protein